MKILVINSGSSSLKFQLIIVEKNSKCLAVGHFDKLGSKFCEFTFNSKNKKFKQKSNISDHKDAVEIAFFTLVESGVIKDVKEISAIGHRVVHGGELYKSPTIITQKVITNIKKLSLLAPLHNPANLKGILAAQKYLKSVKQVAVFDTTFHQTMAPKAYLYGLPYKLYTKNKIRKYGFHGTSHSFVIKEANKILKLKNSKIISCHLGNGISITASLNGKSMDTSMGFTPLEGVMMGTRSGSFDPALIFHLHKNLKLSLTEIYEILNNQSGLKGISGISHDMREIYAKRTKNPRAKLTIEMLSYQIAKYISSYLPTLNGLDAIVFTGGMGENAPYIRESICKNLEFLNISIDKIKNKKSEKQISNKKSKIKVFVIKTNEELEIALETAKLIN